MPSYPYAPSDREWVMVTKLLDNPCYIYVYVLYNNDYYYCIYIFIFRVSSLKNLSDRRFTSNMYAG